MNKVLNILMILLVAIFISFTIKYYSSSKNIVNRDFIRLNIDKILDEKFAIYQFYQMIQIMSYNLMILLRKILKMKKEVSEFLKK